MSGGYFEYAQWRVGQIADDIDTLIENNDSTDIDDFGCQIGRNYPPEIIEKFREASHWLHRSAEMAQRVDWLVSDDDGPESFLRRWEKEVRKSAC